MERTISTKENNEIKQLELKIAVLTENLILIANENKQLRADLDKIQRPSSISTQEYDHFLFLRYMA